MLKWTRWLAAFSCLAHLLLGFSLLFAIGPVSNSAVSHFMQSIFPTLLWPLTFIFVGFMSLISVFKGPLALRLSFYVNSLLMFVWGFTTLFFWILSGSPQPSFAWLLYNGAVNFAVARYALEQEKVQKGLLELKEQLESGQ